jgi:hypothetical protein
MGNIEIETEQYNITLKIIKIQVLITKHGCDFVTLTVDKETPIVCFPDEKLKLRFEVTRGHGIAYIQDNFPGIQIDIIKGD